MRFEDTQRAQFQALKKRRDSIRAQSAPLRQKRDAAKAAYLKAVADLDTQISGIEAPLKDIKAQMAFLCRGLNGKTGAVKS